MDGQIISFNCIVKTKTGQVVSSTYNRDILTLKDLATAGTLAGLNRNLQNLSKGEKRKISVPAEEAYGLYDPRKVILYPRKKIQGPLKKGQPVQIVSKTGVKRNYLILEIQPDFVLLDGNHPLAGQDLIFEVEALAAREATREEIHQSLNVISEQLWH